MSAPHQEVLSGLGLQAFLSFLLLVLDSLGLRGATCPPILLPLTFWGANLNFSSLLSGLVGRRPGSALCHPSLGRERVRAQGGVLSSGAGIPVLAE